MYLGYADDFVLPITRSVRREARIIKDHIKNFLSKKTGLQLSIDEAREKNIPLSQRRLRFLRRPLQYAAISSCSQVQVLLLARPAQSNEIRLGRITAPIKKLLRKLKEAGFARHNLVGSPLPLAKERKRSHHDVGPRRHTKVLPSKSPWHCELLLLRSELQLPTKNYLSLKKFSDLGFQISCRPLCKCSVDLVGD